MALSCGSAGSSSPISSLPTSAMTASTSSRTGGVERKDLTGERLWKRLFAVSALPRKLAAAALNASGLVPWKPKIACLKSPTVKMVRTLSPFAPSPEKKRSEEHTSELQSLMRISYAVFCLKKKTITDPTNHTVYINPPQEEATIDTL